jgi:hypothetical protein
MKVKLTLRGRRSITRACDYVGDSLLRKAARDRGDWASDCRLRSSGHRHSVSIVASSSVTRIKVWSLLRRTD